MLCVFVAFCQTSENTSDHFTARRLISHYVMLCYVHNWDEGVWILSECSVWTLYLVSFHISVFVLGNFLKKEGALRCLALIVLLMCEIVDLWKFLFHRRKAAFWWLKVKIPVPMDLCVLSQTILITFKYICNSWLLLLILVIFTQSLTTVWEKLSLSVKNQDVVWTMNTAVLHYLSRSVVVSVHCQWRDTVDEVVCVQEQKSLPDWMLFPGILGENCREHCRDRCGILMKTQPERRLYFSQTVNVENDI